MKIRSLFLPLTFLALIGFSSCVREYTCQCYIKYTGAPGLPDSTVPREYPIRDTKSKAESLCQGNSVPASTTNGITTTESCDLY